MKSTLCDVAIAALEVTVSKVRYGEVIERVRLLLPVPRLEPTTAIAEWIVPFELVQPSHFIPKGKDLLKGKGAAIKFAYLRAALAVVGHTAKQEFLHGKYKPVFDPGTTGVGLVHFLRSLALLGHTWVNYYEL